MLIAIEAQRIFRQHKHGMDVVALELIRQIQQLDQDNEYILLAAKGPDTNCVQTTGSFTKQILPGLTYADWEQYSLPKALRKLRPALLHCTANTAPVYSNIPLVLTIHDIIYLEQSNFRGSAYQNLGNLYRRYVVPSLIGKAKVIVTVSEFERKAIASAFPEAAHKLRVIYNAVDARFNNQSDKEAIERFRRAHQLPGEFILLLGNTAPKKNTAGALSAFVEYVKSHRDPLPLVVADLDERTAKSLMHAKDWNLLSGRIRFAGYIPFEEMPMLYNAATIFLYPSLRESFGLPLLEAMACGLPVISSGTSALAEIAGGAALLVDPRNAKVMAEAMSALISNEALRATLIAKGLSRVKDFSWRQSAIQLLKVYDELRPS